LLYCVNEVALTEELCLLSATARSLPSKLGFWLSKTGMSRNSDSWGIDNSVAEGWQIGNSIYGTFTAFLGGSRRLGRIP